MTPYCKMSYVVEPLYNNLICPQVCQYVIPYDHQVRKVN